MGIHGCAEKRGIESIVSTEVYGTYKCEKEDHTSQESVGNGIPGGRGRKYEARTNSREWATMCSECGTSDRRG